MQIELFEQALEELAADADLVNHVLEITWEEDVPPWLWDQAEGLIAEPDL